MDKIKKLTSDIQMLTGKWTMPTLVAIGRRGNRFTPLLHSLSIAPSRLTDNLQWLIDQGYVHHLDPSEKRHPALPEYKLTTLGIEKLSLAEKILTLDKKSNKEFLYLKPWVLPISIALYKNQNRFSEIKFFLKNITPKMLSLRLEELVNQKIIEKKVSVAEKVYVYYELKSDCKAIIEDLISSVI